MKLEFISGEDKFEGVELDSTIPVPRSGEFVLLGEPNNYKVYRVTAVSHSYVVMRVFVYVERYTK